jgi:hypothetical protein
MFGAVFIVGGVIGSAVYGTWVQIKKTYKLAMIVMSFLSSIYKLLSNSFIVLSVICLQFSFISESSAITTICCFIVGFNMIPVMVVGFELGVEITYPMGETMSSGVLMSTAQIFGIAYVIYSYNSLTIFSIDCLRVCFD